MPLPTVSVVLIVRNGARFIAEALRSVLLSTVTPMEIIVVDGASTDDTLAIARAAPLVRVVEQHSGNIADAYNIGIAESRGDLVAFISHDDVWLPGKLDVQVAFMVEQPELLYTVTYVQHFLESASHIPAGFRTELLDTPCIGAIMETLVARREVFEHVGLFDPSYGRGEDTEWFARARDGNAAYAILPQTLVRKRVHDDNASLSSPINKDLLRMLRGSLIRKRVNAQPD